MTDVLTPEQRLRNMRSIPKRDTKPELVVRSSLHKAGFRFRLDARDLYGRPDIVLPKFRTAIFVNGCFWHMHRCRSFVMPATRKEFWHEKLTKNFMRDAKNNSELIEHSWRVLTIWECSLRGPYRLGSEEVLRRTEQFIRSHCVQAEIVESGRSADQ